ARTRPRRSCCGLTSKRSALRRKRRALRDSGPGSAGASGCVSGGRVSTTPPAVPSAAGISRPCARALETESRASNNVASQTHPKRTREERCPTAGDVPRTIVRASALVQLVGSSVSLKIDQDHTRFRKIVRGKIRENLRQYISKGE